ncbi:hypothetical protein DEA8626_03231 [Defluviimonas aquaemixtae]|uniref:Peptidoglycan binding-like domain-containing protein n=1 Tax=Albidovulum aquaemixtae TaxID=1542388 RepID=A0A2R8BL67_9RHOB|nr:peptidoglycan-binding protein [Defluviimonas aquaemixtae]SPH24182.1 hypothetical protein DEA8626_03231 [Defluviimonas aquaemixtae]
MIRMSLTAIAAICATTAFAQDAALVIGNENYRNASDISRADNALDAVDALETAGFATVKGSDLPAEQLRELLAQHYDGTEEPGRSLILAAGHFVHAGKETWLLGTDADEPSLATVDAAGIPLSTLLAIAAERPGGALVLLGTEERRIALGRGLLAGIGNLDVPQGVTVIFGDAATVADFAAEVVVERGLTAADLAIRAEDEDLVAAGFMGGALPFLPADGAEAPPRPEDNASAERTLWEVTQAIGTKRAYETYLSRYPRGIYAAAARNAIADAEAATSDPVARARAAEEALSLTRDQRRQVQRDLSILDIDPRGIDGVFGPGSRSAISAWQRRNGHEATGFITGPQRAALAAQAEDRAAELEVEAAERKATQDRQDRLYWEQTGAAGDEAGLRAYLKRHPDGLYAETAQERLSVFDRRRRAEAEETDRIAWETALKYNTPKIYQNYIDAHPDGAFVDEARRRIAAANETDEDSAARQQAAQVEKALGLNPVMLSLVEQRLTALGLNPGKADGNFDADTRRAIRRYQQARGLPVTGFLSQQTVARLLVDSL